MGGLTEIAWCDSTFNPWIGCTKISAGCTNCYAKTQQDDRYGRVQWGPKGNRVRTSRAYWRQPLRWQIEAASEGKITRVFCASLADVFDDHPSIDPAWRADLWETVRATQGLEWLLLTKRPENWARFLPVSLPSALHRNIRLGVTIEDQAAADERGDLLRAAHEIGWPTFVSYEPALGPVDWAPLMPSIDWLICGGESGSGARSFDIDWGRYARKAALDAGRPFLMKQIGSSPFWFPAGDWPLSHRKGGDPADWPSDLRVREFPPHAQHVNLSPV